jgi:hypothetical protein
LTRYKYFSWEGNGKKNKLTWTGTHARSNIINNFPVVVYARRLSFVFAVFSPSYGSPFSGKTEWDIRNDGLRRFHIHIDFRDLGSLPADRLVPAVEASADGSPGKI